MPNFSRKPTLVATDVIGEPFGLSDPKWSNLGSDRIVGFVNYPDYNPYKD